MRLYDSVGPNPRLVRMFLAEKGSTCRPIEVDLMAGENRRAAYREKNPFGQLPALELDDGRVIAETTVICEYLEELQPRRADRQQRRRSARRRACGRGASSWT